MIHLTEIVYDFIRYYLKDSQERKRDGLFPLCICLSVCLCFLLSEGAIQSTEIESETYVLDVKVNAKENNWCNCLIGGCQVSEEGRKCN